MTENLSLAKMLIVIVTDKEAKFKSKTNYPKNNDGSVNDCLFCKKKTTTTTEDLQQSRKFAAISNSSAISGAMGNSGISVLLLVYRTLYMK